MYLVPTLFHSSLELLLQTIFQQYLLTSYCLTIVTDNGAELNISPSVFISLKVKNETNLTNKLRVVNEMGCSDYIIRVSDPENFIKAFDGANQIATARRGDKKLIFLPSDETKSQELLNILSKKELSFVANVLLVLRNYERDNKCEVYNLMTHQFVGLKETEKPIVLDEWDSCTKNFSLNSNLFPHDLSNLEGKLLKVATFTNKPYILLDVDTNISPLGRDGIEVRLTDEFCRRVNCTIEIVRDDNGQWGIIYDNRTGNGVLGNVAEDRADVGIDLMSKMTKILQTKIEIPQLCFPLLISGLCSWYHEYQYMDFAATHIRTGITGIAPSPRFSPSWKLPLHPFSFWLWLAVLITFFYASVAMVIVKRGSTDGALLITFGMMVTQTQPHVDKSWRVRVVTGWMVIIGLVVDNAYGGGLASTFTVPQFEKSTDTIQDLVDSSMYWAATHDAWIFSLLSSKEPKIIHLVNKFKKYDRKSLHQKSYSRTLTFGIEKLPAGSYAIGDYITRDAAEDLEIMLEEFYWEHCVVVARKSSPYTAKISELVGRLHEAGIILAWENQVALKYLDFKVQLEIRLSRVHRDREVTSLNFYHVVGIFIVYAMGVASSFLLFIGEIIYYKRKNN